MGWDFGGFFPLFGVVWFWVFRCASVGGGVFGGRFVCLFVGWLVCCCWYWQLVAAALVVVTVVAGEKGTTKTKLGAACVVVVSLTEVWQFVRALACLLVGAFDFVFWWHIMLAPVCEVVQCNREQEFGWKWLKGNASSSWSESVTLRDRAVAIVAPGPV